MRPMAKRRAEVELNQDNWDEDVETQEAGTFQKAEASSLTTRKILSVKSRRSVTQGTSGLFKSFTGLSNPSQLGDVKFNFGVKAGSTDGSVPPVSTPLPSSSESIENETEYLKQLQTLNQNLLDWITKHVKDDPHCILTPVFQDYEKHLKKLRDSFTQNNCQLPSATSVQSTIFVSTSASGSNGLGHALFSTPFSQLNTPVSGFEKNVERVTSLPVISTATATTTASEPSKPAFSFSFPPITSNASQPPLFKFGSSLSSASPFAPSTAQTTTSTIPTTNTAADADDNEAYEPPQPVVREIKEEGSVYSVKCKLFYKMDTEWKDRGVGNLFIKPTSDDKFQLLVRADTNLGNILLNILMTKDIPVKCQKNNLTFVCVPSPPIPQNKQTEADSSKPIPMLLRVKSEEGAKELLKQFDKYRGMASSC